MKQKMKWFLFGALGLVVLLIIMGSSGGNEDLKDSFEKGRELGRNGETAVVERVEDGATEEVKTQHAVLSGADPETGELLLANINVWQEAGGGGSDNVAIGNVPHNTKVEVLESAEVDGVTFYHIRSAAGKVSVLPTEWTARGKAMEERPENEWFVDADESFPVDGWVTDSFITDLN